MSNRVQYFIRTILQNSKLNREKIINNKEIYKLSISKNNQQNYNKIIKRKMSSYEPPLSFGGGPNNNNNNNNNNRIIYMIVVAGGAYISSFLTGKKGKKNL
jgi:hypothetical protein